MALDRLRTEHMGWTYLQRQWWVTLQYGLSRPHVPAVHGHVERRMSLNIFQCTVETWAAQKDVCDFIMSIGNRDVQRRIAFLVLHTPHTDKQGKDQMQLLGG